MSMNDDTHDDGFRFTGWHMLACMIAFFGVIIVVNIFMAFMASGTWTGLVVKNSYIASQKFNGELAQAKLQKDSGLRSRIGYAGGQLSFAISDRNGKTVMPSRATIWTGRPAFEQQDRLIEATCDRDGRCMAAAELAPGRWAIRFEATLPDTTYRRDAQLFVSQNGTVQVE